MNHDEMIEIIKAHKEGKKIQYKCEGKWCDKNPPLWNFEMFEYRIAPQKNLPTSWEELESISGYYIEDESIIEVNSITTYSYNKNIYATEKQAKSALAYAQLTQLMKVYNGDWTPDWGNYSYVIGREGNHLATYVARTSFHFLAFKDAGKRGYFLKHHRTLIEQFFMIGD